MSKIKRIMLKVFSRIPEINNIAQKIQNADIKFYSSINNDKKKIIFGLTSLLENHNNQYQRRKSRKRGRLIAFSAITLAGGVTLCYAKYDSDFRSVLKKYVPFVDPVIKTIFFEKEEKPLSSSYGIKSTIVGFVYGSKSKNDKTIQASNYNKDFSKGVTDYIPSFGTIKRGTGHVLCATYNGIKRPITSLFSTNTPKLDEAENKDFNKGVTDYIPSFGTIKQGTGHILSGTYNGIKKPITSLFSTNTPQLDEAENKGGSWCYIEVPKRELNKIINILQNNIQPLLMTNVSKEEKWKLVSMWLEQIGNVYNILSTPVSNTILSQYSKHSKKFNKLITDLSEEGDYSTLVKILVFATVISLQLLIIAYFNVPFTDQMANIAFSVYDNATLLKNDPNIQEMLNARINELNNYLPLSYVAKTLNSVDWKCFVNVMIMAYSTFTSLASYGK